MTCNVFGGTLNLAQSINQTTIIAQMLSIGEEWCTSVKKINISDLYNTSTLTGNSRFSRTGSSETQSPLH